MSALCKPEDVVAAARGYKGTPFRHQGRTRFGLDCVGLIITVAKELNLMKCDFLGYSKDVQIKDGFMPRFREAGLKEVQFEDRRIGDVLVMHENRFPCHAAFITSLEPMSVIHAYARRRRVVEERYTSALHAQFAGLFRFPQFQT